MNNSGNKTNFIVKVALLLSIATVLMLIEFPILPAYEFLKLDISDLPALIGAFAFGPIAGILIEGLKNVLHILIKGTQTGGIGELANFMIGSSFVGVAAIIYQRNKTKKTAIYSVIAGSIVMTAVAVPMNYYVLIPMYKKFLPFINDAWTRTYIFAGIIPFNLIKAFIISTVTLLIYKRVAIIIKAEGFRADKARKNSKKIA